MFLKVIKKKIRENNFLRKKFLSFSIFLHNYSYSLIKKFLVRPGELHPKHRIMGYHNFFVKNVNESDKVLDIGCGNGALAHDVAEKAKKVAGIDINKTNIKIANEKYKRENLEFIYGDATSYDFSKLGIKKFDKIILSNILEHIENRIDFLNNLHKLSDIILLRVPMLNRDWLTVYKKENEYKYILDPGHFIEYTLESLKEELETSGWEIANYSVQFGETWGIIINKS